MGIQDHVSGKADCFEWDSDISVISNLRVWKDLSMIALFVYLTILVIFGLIFLPQREWDLMLMVAWAFPVAIVGLLLIGLVLLTALTGNRFRLHYQMNDEGALLAVTDHRARAVSRLTFAIGAMVGSLSATGTGILTMAGEFRGVPWDALTGARFLPRRHQILLKSDWRTQLVLYCPTGLYDTIARHVSGRLKQTEPDEAKPGTPSPARLVMQTIAVILACIPLVLLPYPFEPDIFAAIWLLLCGGVSIWLEPRVAYAVLLGVAAAIARVGWVFLFEEVNLRMGGYGSLDSWGAQMALVALGLVYLTWFAIRTLVRRATR